MSNNKAQSHWWDDPGALKWWDALDANWRVMLKACFLKHGPLEAEPVSETHKRDLLRMVAGVDCLRLHLPDVNSLEPVRQLQSLQQLHCLHTQITDLEPLQSLPCLEEVNLTGSRITSLESLRGCTKLKRLWLYRIAIDSLEPLYGLDTLERLGVSAQLPASEIRRFQRQQPGCQVYFLQAGQRLERFEVGDLGVKAMKAGHRKLFRMRGWLRTWTQLERAWDFR